MSSIGPYPQFPDADALALAFFEEGIRHLEDAHILHEADRYPAAIASAMKATEFGVKSIVILGGAMGWWDKVFTSHSPYTDMNNLPMFEHHIQTIAAHNRILGVNIMEMESLAPARPGGSYEIDKQKNPEYPFLSYHRASAVAPSEFRLDKPSKHFGETDSKKYCNTAQDLLTAIKAQYATVGGWGLMIPGSL